MSVRQLEEEWSLVKEEWLLRFKEFVEIIVVHVDERKTAGKASLVVPG